MSLLYIIGSEVATTAGFAAAKYLYGKIKGKKKTRHKRDSASDMLPIINRPTRSNIATTEEVSFVSTHKLGKYPLPTERDRELERGERVKVSKGSVDRNDVIGSLPESLVLKLSTEFGSLPSQWESYRNVVNQTFVISCPISGKSITLCDSLDFDPEVLDALTIPVEQGLELKTKKPAGPPNTIYSKQTWSH